MITDVTRMGEWSPETYRVEWQDGATGPAVGARFKGWNRHGVLRWSTKPRVTALEQDRVFEFDTGSTRWRYEFRPLGDGTTTEVVESFDTHGPWWLELVNTATFRDRSLTKGMEATLQRIKAAAERSA